MNPHIRLLDSDDQNIKGCLLNMNVEVSNLYLACSFENGSISIYDLREGVISKELPPMERCFVNILPFNAQIQIDDNCTFAAYLDQNQRDIIFYTFDWDLKVKKLEKPGLSNVNSNN